MGMNIVQAQEYNLRGVELGPDNFLTLFLAGSNFDVGRISDAISYLLRAKQIAPYGPNDVDPQLIRAYLYAKKQVTDSISKAEKIATEMMTHPEDYKVFWGNVYSVYIIYTRRYSVHFNYYYRLDYNKHFYAMLKKQTCYYSSYLL